MSSQYSAEWPSSGADPAYVQFFETFYKTSDTPDAHEAYADSFTEDATLVMISNRVQGRDAIHTLRQGMWQKVAKRSHTPLKVFPFPASSGSGGQQELMLHGLVSYVLKDGKAVNDVPWSARAVVVKEGEKVRMSAYHVYLDSAAMVPKEKI